jgi:hypothetical protein
VIEDLIQQPPPHMFWAKRLRQLKQPDWSDHDLVVFLAKVLREKESICAEYLSGRRAPERTRQLELGRLLTNHLKRQRRSIMTAVQAAVEPDIAPPVAGGVYEMPLVPPDYRGLYMVAEDGVMLVEIRVHKRAIEKDLVPGFRAWRQRVTEKELREGNEAQLALITLDGGEKVS